VALVNWFRNFRKRKESGDLVVRFFNTYEPVTSFYRDLLPFLASRGLKAEVFLSASEYREGRGSLATLQCDSIRLSYAPRGWLRSRGNIKKFVEMVSYALWCSLKTMCSSGRSLNLFLTQPPLFSFWGYVLKRLRKQPYVCLVMDVYPDVALRDGLLRKNSVIALAALRLSRCALNNADRVVVIGRCMKEYLGKDIVQKNRVEIIPNWANENVIHPVAHEGNPMRRELGLQGKFVVLYSGNMGVSHLFDDLLEVARRLKAEDRINFVFIGKGARRSEIEKAKEVYDLKNVQVVPFQPIGRLHYSLSMGDVHFFSLRAGFEGLVVPSKAYGVMAAGRPIIYQGNETGEIARMITEERIGTVLPTGNPDLLKEAILRYYHQPALANGQGEKAYHLSRNRYSKEQGVKKYAEIIESVLAEKGMLKKNAF
jgi:colanic acid biosynthesis glycosyl transferase WcaI